MAAPPGLVTAEHLASDYSHIQDLVIARNSASWEEQLSESGQGRVTINNARGNGTPIVRPISGDMVAFSIDGTRYWVMLLDTYDPRIRVGKGGKGGQTTTLNGRGTLTIFEASLSYPTFGLSSYPKQTDLHFDYRHPLYDDSAWVAPTVIVSVDDAKSGGGSPWPIPWTPNMPGGPGSSTQIVWASSGTETSAPVGRVYFRHEFTVTWDGTYDFYFTCDNSGEFYMDGCFIAAAGGPGSIAEAGFTTTGDLTLHIHLTPGTHVLSGFGENWPPYGGLTSPGGIAYAGYIPGPTPVPVVESRAGTGMVINEYPPEPPGMTVGNAIRLNVENAQNNYGEILDVTLDFDDFVDTDGNNWAVDGDDTILPCISTKTLTDIHAFLREVSASYCDIRMGVNSNQLKAWNFGTMNLSTPGVSMLPGINATGLEQRGIYRIVNAVIGEYQGGYLEVTDPASIAIYGRKAAQFQIGAVDDVNEALRVLTKALAAFTNPRDEIMVQAVSPVGYKNYDIGNRLTTEDADEAHILERCLAIAVRQSSTGQALTTPTVKDLFL